MLKLFSLLFSPILLLSQITSVPSTGGSSSTITGLLLARTSASKITVSTGKAQFNGVTANLNSTYTIDITGGTDTGTLYIYIKYNSGTPQIGCIYGAGVNPANLSNTGIQTCTSGSGFPGIPDVNLGTAPISSGAFTTAVTDERGVVNMNTYTAGAGITITGNSIASQTFTCFDTAGLGLRYLLTAPNGTTTTNDFPAIGANTNMVFQFVFPCNATVGQLTMEVQTASGTCAGTCGFATAIYDSAKNLLGQTTTITSGGSPNLNTTGLKTLTFATPITLTPGVYYFAASTNSTALILRAMSSDGFAQTIQNNIATRIGTAANTSTGTSTIVMPSTLGSISAITNTRGNLLIVAAER